MSPNPAGRRVPSLGSGDRGWGVDGKIESLIFLVAAVVLLAQLARLANVPYPVFLVL